MRRKNKILLGVLAFFPVCYIVFFFVVVMLFVLSMLTFASTASTSSTGQPDALPIALMAPFFALFGLHFLAILTILAQLVVYIVLLFRNPRLRDNERIAWLVAILLAGPIGTPVYWYLQIWKAPDAPNTPPA